MIISATFGNAEGTVVRAVFADGSIGPVAADDPRLSGVDVASYAEPSFALRTLPPLAFFDRFTAAEEEAIAQAALAGPQVLLWLTRAAGATEISLDNERTQAGIGLLVFAGLLTAERAAEILA